MTIDELNNVLVAVHDECVAVRDAHAYRVGYEEFAQRTLVEAVRHLMSDPAFLERVANRINTKE